MKNKLKQARALRRYLLRSGGCGIALIAAMSMISPAVAAPSDKNNAHTVSVSIPDVKDTGSTVYCGLFKGKEGFPSARDKATWVRGKVNGGEADTECIFRGVQKGEYAVSVLEDQDGDREMDTNWFGIPQERWAVSKNVAPGTLSGPNYSEARFSVTSDMSLTLRLRRTS